MQRMHHAIFRRCRRGHKSLAQHLSAEYLRTPDIAALTAKQVQLEPFERHHLDQIIEQLIHSAPQIESAWPASGPATPRRFCMMGLVVVYCKNCRFSGNK